MCQRPTLTTPETCSWGHKDVTVGQARDGGNFGWRWFHFTWRDTHVFTICLGICVGNRTWLQTGWGVEVGCGWKGAKLTLRWLIWKEWSCRLLRWRHWERGRFSVCGMGHLIKYLGFSAIQRGIHFTVCYCLYYFLLLYKFSLIYNTLLTNEGTWIFHFLFSLRTKFYIWGDRNIFVILPFMVYYLLWFQLKQKGLLHRNIKFQNWQKGPGNCLVNLL